MEYSSDFHPGLAGDTTLVVVAHFGTKVIVLSVSASPAQMRDTANPKRASSASLGSGLAADARYPSDKSGRARNSRGRAPSAAITIPARSICSTILAERLYPILSRR